MSILVSPGKKNFLKLSVNHQDCVSLVNLPYRRLSGSEDTKRPWQQVHEEHGNFWRPQRQETCQGNLQQWNIARLDTVQVFLNQQHLHISPTFPHIFLGFGWVRHASQLRVPDRWNSGAVKSPCWKVHLVQAEVRWRPMGVTVEPNKVAGLGWMIQGPRIPH